LAYTEDNVYPRPILYLNIIAVEVRAVDVLVEEVTLRLCSLRHDREASLLEHVLNVKPTHVNGPADRGVIVGALSFAVRLPLAQNWTILRVLSD
jgi:hypothetical protein